MYKCLPPFLLAFLPVSLLPFMVLWIKSKASCILGKCSVTKLYTPCSSPKNFVFIFIFCVFISTLK